MAEIDTRLVIVEGPPCSGKSETAQYIAEMAGKNGHHVSLFEENDMNHPADYAFHAFMTEEQIRPLTQEERRDIYAESVKALNGYIIPLTKVSVSLFGKIVPYKIYDRLDWATEREVLLEHWQSFAKWARVTPRLHVFDSCLLQHPLSETMMRFDFGYSELKAYIDDIYGIIAPLDPVVVYLRCTDIKSRVEVISEQRTAVWLDSAVTYHTSQGYGSRRGLTGFDGYISCLNVRQETELELIDQLPIKKLILTDPFCNWDEAYDTIESFFTGKALQKT